MDHLRKLIEDGTVKLVDGKVLLTSTAWRLATDSSIYYERRVWHFVGFKNDRYWNAAKAFGKPDFIHRFWDRRAKDEVMPEDVVVFADGDEHQEVQQYAFDDSANF